MRFAGIALGEQLKDLVLGEFDPELPPQVVDPVEQFFRTEHLAAVDDLIQGGGIRVETVAEDMVLPQLVPAGKLDPGDEAGIVLFQ